ncbi:MAG: type II secretion system F family protein [Acidimicrobiales bacterium]
MTATVVALALVVLAAVGPSAARSASVARARRRALVLVGTGLDNEATGRTHGAQDRGVPAWFGAGLAHLEIDATPERAWSAALVAGAVCSCWAALAAPGVLIAAAVGLATVVAAGRVWARRAPTRGYEADLLASVGTLGASLRSGASLGQALERASHTKGPCGADLALVRSRIAAGWTTQAALDQWAQDTPESAVSLVADALAVAGSSGASQGGAVVAVADTMRDRANRAREVRALASQARASCVVLVLLPLAFAASAAVLDRRVAAFLLTTVGGWACLAGGLALDATGGWWMSRLVRQVS